MALKVYLLIISIVFVYSGCLASYVEAVAGIYDLSKGQPEPRIAMYCGEINMHVDLDTGKWVPDEDEQADCIEKPIDILEYCKKIYPDLEITNVVDASEEEKINDWCRVGNVGKCKHSHKVQPYRCIVGEFESDALMVPNDCKFSHIHDSLVCLTHDKWVSQARESCISRGMGLYKTGMLLPCKIDEFSGVEFVCCPEKPKEDIHNEPIVEAEPIDIEEVDVEEDEDDPYFKLEDEDPKEEHMEFEEARERLEQHHRERMAKVMKLWEEAEDNYEKMKKSDPVAAERERKEMMERFQATVMSLEQESEAVKQQLRDTHLNRIEKQINKKKQNALDAYTKALQDVSPKPKDVLQGLQKFIHAEHKDRVHSLHHFEHLRQTNPKKADDIKPALLEHLHEIDDRVNQSIEMLKRQLPNMYSVLSDKINDMIRKDDKFVENSLLLKPVPVMAVDDTKPETEETQNEELQVEKIEQPAQFDWSDDENDEMDPDVKDMLKSTVMPEETTYDDETMEDESILPVEQKKAMEPQYAANKNSNFKVKESFNKAPSVMKKKLTDTHKSALALGFGGGAVAVATVVIVALVIVRKKSQRVPVNHGFVEVDPKMTMEQRHINMMQQNGYENPTYKYFEMQ
ncbi:amyloid beta precursor like protein 2-like [Ptychodera flava]|uniref:amyloid beta precursor like protein 2-like n=1 Tax=Ptychodera flava TaxID=63121 RepID=UPI003969D77E